MLEADDGIVNLFVERRSPILAIFSFSIPAFNWLQALGDDNRPESLELLVDKKLDRLRLFWFTSIGGVLTALECGL